MSDEGCRNLHKYKYSGTDASLTYRFLLSPLAELLVKLFPLSVAANSVRVTQITLAGHFCCLLMYGLPWLYCGNTLSCLLPSWLIVLCVVFYFAWIVLDNIDGKQARRTNNSTPLGLLFDHQVDAINVTLTTSFLGTLFLYGDSPYTLLLWFTGALPFYFATWEELVLGSLDLPFINGPCEGCMILGLMSLAAAWLGPEYFVSTVVYGAELRGCFMVFFMVTAVATALYK
jgi:ethanolaminephosphotransferase